MRPDGTSGWQTSVLVGQPFARLGAVLVLGLGERVVAPLAGGTLQNSPDASYYGPPYQLAVFSLSARTPVTTPSGVAQRYALAAPLETLDIGAVPIALWQSTEDDEIVAVTHDSVVHRIGLNPLRELSTSTVPAFRDRSLPIAEIISKASAALSPDGRWLVTTRWDAGGIVLTDLESGEQRGYAEDYDRRRIGAVAFSGAGPTKGMLAVHVRSAVKFYRVEGGELVKLSNRTISPPSYPKSDDCRGMRFVDVQCGELAQPLGWSPDGRQLVVASFSGNAEFAVLDVDPIDASGPKPHYIEVCGRSPDNGGENQGSVVVSTNGGAYTRPSPTPTSPPPTATVTDLPSPTPIDLTPTAEPISSQTPRPTVLDPTATVTDLPSATETAQGISTSTPLPVATSTKLPVRRMFLPLAMVEQCPPRDLFTDVVLVIDTSSSMAEMTIGQRRKIDVTIDAVTDFLQGLRLTSGKDRASLVTFNNVAQTLQRLTSDKARLVGELAQVQLATFSRIDLGLRQATTELLIRGQPGRLQSIVLLSDGKANPVPAEQAIEAARQAQRAGITVYVVGMGPDMDEMILRKMSSGPSRYFGAQDPLLIRSIYQDLARLVPCPADAFWGRR
jgi:methylmalonyl-CoA mutase cobalamin-binding subunit